MGPGYHFDVCDSIELCIVELTRVACIYILQIRSDLEKLNDSTVISAFQATIGGRFAPIATLVDEDADLDSMVTHFKKAITDTAAELFGKEALGYP